MDRVTFKEYERDLDANVADLVGRLVNKRYRAKLVRRKYIPKANGKFRPLGIPALEDKLLQMAVARVLEAIYEQDFLDCSWGYRPKRGPREAGRVLASRLHRGKIKWVVEADIRGFFDNISHKWMVRMLKERIADGALLNLIVKWLKAGVMETDGKVVHPATGTPQGGIVSPILANIYLHYVLDLWVEHQVKKDVKGDEYMMRFADDFVYAFQNREEAIWFEKVLKERLGKFGLSVADEKTRTLQFNRFEMEASGTFDFLGFEFSWVKRQTGRIGVRRRTSPKRLRASIRAFTEWIRKSRHERLSSTMATLRSKFGGYWNYYGVQGNMEMMRQFYTQCLGVLFKWLNRRSQKRSLTWDKFKAMLKKFLIPAPQIVEPDEQPSFL